MVDVIERMLLRLRGKLGDNDFHRMEDFLCQLTLTFATGCSGSDSPVA